jgi:hypothetical protein
MSALVALAIVIAGAAGAIVRALLIDQVRGQIQRHLTQSVESTIASLPDDLQAEWGEEWRAELSACILMPVTAARFARGLRARAHKLVDDLEPAVPPKASSHRGRHWRPLPRVVSVRRILPRELLAGRKRVLARVDMSVVASVASVVVAAAFACVVLFFVGGSAVAAVVVAAAAVFVVLAAAVVRLVLRGR